MKALRILLLALAFAAGWSGAAATESWPLLGLYGYTGSLGLGGELEFSLRDGVTEAEAGLLRSVSLSAGGFSLHPNFLTWDASTDLSWGREVTADNASVSLQLLPRHPTPATILAVRSRETRADDFQPVREAVTDEVEAQLLLGAYGYPTFLHWSTSETTLADSVMPRHSLLRTESAGASRPLGRDHNLTWKYEVLQTEDLLQGREVRRATAQARLESRFWYDLVKLKSSYSRATERGQHSYATTLAGEELEVSHSPDWTSRLRVKSNETVKDGDGALKLELGGETSGRLGHGFGLSLNGQLTEKRDTQVVRQGLGVGGRLNWNGHLGYYRVGLSAGSQWQPERGQGSYVFPVRGETVQLWLNPLAQAGAQPLLGTRIRLASLRVYLATQALDLARGRDYEVIALGEENGLAEQVYVAWCPTSLRVDEEQLVLVDYEHELPAGDTEKVTHSESFNVGAGLDNLSLALVGNAAQIREYSTVKPSTLSSEDGLAFQMNFADGPFSMSTYLNRRDGTEGRTASVIYRAPRFSASHTVNRSLNGSWDRRRDVSRLSFDVVQGGAFRLKGFAQTVVGSWGGERAGAERAFQTGVDGQFFPLPNCVVDGSLSYLKDWKASNRDQAVLGLKADWWLGQLRVGLDSELEADLARQATRGKVKFLVTRLF